MVVHIIRLYKRKKLQLTFKNNAFKLQENAIIFFITLHSKVSDYCGLYMNYNITHIIPKTTSLVIRQISTKVYSIWKRVVLIAIFAGFAIIVFTFNKASADYSNRKHVGPNFRPPTQTRDNWRNLSDAQKASLTKLGRVLFLNEERPPPRNTSFVILVWKYGSTTHNRHMQHYTNKEIDPFATCAVQNCVVTYEDAAVTRADLLIFHLHRTTGVDDVPQTRKASQIRAFSTDESPFHTFLNGKHNLPAYSGMFNWSMHYRMDADIPVPYGRTVIKERTDETVFDIDAWQRNRSDSAPVAVMGSNCGSKNHRWEYVKELQRWIDVDFYGGCGTLKCGGYYSDCSKLSRYRFYLAFENSNCDEYITEKLWWNAFAKGAVPIVMGGAPARRNYAQLLPPGSYISVEDFAAPRDLAHYLAYLLANPRKLAAYFQWRGRFDVHNEHGYFQTNPQHYCRACEALNYNDRAPKTYTDLATYWTTDRCAPAWDAE